MYSEIFKDGVTDEAIKKAGEHALECCIVGIEYREAIRNVFGLYNSHGLILIEENKSSVMTYFREKSGYDYLKVNPMVSIPPNHRDWYKFQEKSDFFQKGIDELIKFNGKNG